MLICISSYRSLSSLVIFEYYLSTSTESFCFSCSYIIFMFAFYSLDNRLALSLSTYYLFLPISWSMSLYLMTLLIHLKRYLAPNDILETESKVQSGLSWIRFLTRTYAYCVGWHPLILTSKLASDNIFRTFSQLSDSPNKMTIFSIVNLIKGCGFMLFFISERSFLLMVWIESMASLSNGVASAICS